MIHFCFSCIDGYPHSAEFTYFHCSDKQRIKSELKQNGTSIETKLYWGNMEKLTKGSTTYEVYYIAAGNGLNNIIVKQGSAISIYYTFTDQLGSIVAIENLQRNIG